MSRITKENTEIGGHSITDTFQCFDILLGMFDEDSCMVEVDQEDFFIRLILILETNILILSIRSSPRALASPCT